MKYRHIVFDIDGTLLDTEYAVLHSLRDALLELYGTNIPLSELTFALGIPGEDALKRLEIQDIPGTIKRWNEHMERYGSTVSLFMGIKKLLEDLEKLNYKLGIVTSKTREEFEQEFPKFNVSSCFNIVICADDTKEHKPAPDPLLKYLELSKAKRGQVLYVGDSQYDSQCAAKAGIDFALAVWGSQGRTVNADYRPSNPNALLSELLFHDFQAVEKRRKQEYVGENPR